LDRGQVRLWKAALSCMQKEINCKGVDNMIKDNYVNSFFVKIGTKRVLLNYYFQIKRPGIAYYQTIENGTVLYSDSEVWS